MNETAIKTSLFISLYMSKLINSSGAQTVISTTASVTRKEKKSKNFLICSVRTDIQLCLPIAVVGSLHVCVYVSANQLASFSWGGAVVTAEFHRVWPSALWGLGQ